MGKYFALLLLFFFQALFIYSQRPPLYQWTSLSVDKNQLFATHSYHLFTFSNECIHIENGLGIWKNYPTGGTFTYPCMQTSEKIKLQHHIYPSPASTLINIRAMVYTNLQQVVTLMITDAIGRLFIRKKCTLYDLQQGMKIGVSHFSSGVYFLRIEGDGISGFKRFLKITN